MQRALVLSFAAGCAAYSLTLPVRPAVVPLSARHASVLMQVRIGKSAHCHGKKMCNCIHSVAT